MAKNKIELQTEGLDAVLDRLKALAGADTKQIVTDALTEIGKEIADDTLAAMADANLPAKGVYSRDRTIESVVKDPTPEWNGETAEMPIGFDFSKEGAGGWLISGTPTMSPNRVLNRMYKGKKYMSDKIAKLGDTFWKTVREKEGQ